jgi:hypothetical protein
MVTTKRFWALWAGLTAAVGATGSVLAAPGWQVGHAASPDLGVPTWARTAPCPSGWRFRPAPPAAHWTGRHLPHVGVASHGRAGWRFRTVERRAEPRRAPHGMASAMIPAPFGPPLAAAPRRTAYPTPLSPTPVGLPPARPYPQITQGFRGGPPLAGYRPWGARPGLRAPVSDSAWRSGGTPAPAWWGPGRSPGPKPTRPAQRFGPGDWYAGYRFRPWYGTRGALAPARAPRQWPAAGPSHGPVAVSVARWRAPARSRGYDWAAGLPLVAEKPPAQLSPLPPTGPLIGRMGTIPLVGTSWVSRPYTPGVFRFRPLQAGADPIVVRVPAHGGARSAETRPASSRDSAPAVGMLPPAPAGPYRPGRGGGRPSVSEDGHAPTRAGKGPEPLAALTPGALRLIGAGVSAQAAVPAGHAAMAEATPGRRAPTVGPPGRPSAGPRETPRIARLMPGGGPGHRQTPPAAARS